MLTTISSSYTRTTDLIIKLHYYYDNYFHGIQVRDKGAKHDTFLITLMRVESLTSILKDGFHFHANVKELQIYHSAILCNLHRE